MEKADVEKTPANMRHNQLILLRLLSGLLLKWREIVKAAKQHPEIAHCLFDTPIKDGGPSQLTEWTCKTVSKEEVPPISAPHRTGKEQEKLTVNAEPYTQGGEHKGEESVMPSTHLHFHTSASSSSPEGLIHDLFPDIDWIHALQGQYALIPQENDSAMAKQRHKMHCSGEILDAHLLENVTKSVRTAFNGMRALQLTMERRKEGVMSTSVNDTAMAFQRHGKGMSIASGLGSHTLLAQFVQLCETNHCELRETLLKLHGSLLRRMMHILKEVIYELQGMKRGLRDSVELCSIQKKHIRRLSTELHGEEQMRPPSHGARRAFSCHPLNPFAVKGRDSIASNTGTSRNTQPLLRASYSLPETRSLLDYQMFIHEGKNGGEGSVTQREFLESSLEYDWKNSPGTQDTSRTVGGGGSGGDWHMETVGGRTSKASGSRRSSPLTFGLSVPMDSVQHSINSGRKKEEVPFGRDSEDVERHIASAHSSFPPHPFQERLPNLPREPRAYIIPRFGFAVEAREGSSGSSLQLEVVDVEHASPAHWARLAVGDFVLGINDDEIPSTIDMWEGFLARLSLETGNGLSLKVLLGGGRGIIAHFILQDGYSTRNPVDNCSFRQNECNACGERFERVNSHNHSTHQLPESSARGSTASLSSTQQSGLVVRVSGKVIRWSK
ncbi:hypothetical protein MOQ_002184 [Trypanosoma cruzi marinkellei]|uniref:PDZ domain-containing protein n=1 Tax=Trypanosoma cruzi marinkellei TaxID=85056 RepID=K2NRQ2_TRYCR|nr:hypothetical protein MOQ_002184 [Trypanosoma cruzi marinkellei]